ASHLVLAAEITTWTRFVLEVGICAYAFLCLRRIGETGEDEPPVAAVDAHAGAPLPPTWRRGALGIDLYLGGALGRVGVLLSGFLVMMGARGADSLGALSTVRENVLLVATLSGLATLVVLLGLFFVALLPAESNASPAARMALVFAAAGFALDL